MSLPPKRKASLFTKSREAATTTKDKRCYDVPRMLVPKVEPVLTVQEKLSIEGMVAAMPPRVRRISQEVANHETKRNYFLLPYRPKFT